MSIFDVFNQDAFNVLTLSRIANENIPFVPKQVSSMGIFEEEPIATTTVALEEQDMTLGMVAPSPRGGPGETAGTDGRRIRNFSVPHYQRDDSVLADEVQGVRRFGSEARVEDLQQLLARKMRKHAIALDATLEHQRIGALKGLILDKNGNTLYNLATEFGVSIPSAVDWTLGTSTTALRQKMFDLVESVEAALDGVEYEGIDILCGSTFFKKFIDHAEVKNTYLNWQAAAEMRGVPLNKFEWGNANWYRYRTGAQATAANTGGAFIGTSDARVVVRGVPGMFVTWFAPADYEDTVNTLGIPRYMRQYAMPNGKGRNVDIQTNALSICTRPKALLSLTTSN